jgi:ligand-binding sensor domain-containing protein
MKKLLILTLFCIVAFAELIAQQHFSFMHYTSDQGLSQNNVTAMHKDKKGFLWVSTRDGLNRFDGRVFKSYNQYFSRKFSGSSNRFLEIKEDHVGNLWLRS